MPQNLNLVFGSNLRKLCEQRGTFSLVARELDVSRVQLMRFIRGESFPKPAQLARLCELFGVDARILLEPLDQISSTVILPRHLEALRDELGKTLPNDTDIAASFDALSRMGQIAPSPVPPGLHLMLRPSFLLEDLYVAHLILVRLVDGRAIARAFEVPPPGMTRGSLGRFASRSFSGICLGTSDGVVFHFKGTGDLPFLSTAHLSSHSYLAATGSLRGVYELYRAPHPAERRRVPVVLSLLQQKPSVILRAARSTGFHGINAMPSRFRAYLEAPLSA